MYGPIRISTALSISECERQFRSVLETKGIRGKMMSTDFQPARPALVPKGTNPALALSGEPATGDSRRPVVSVVGWTADGRSELQVTANASQYLALLGYKGHARSLTTKFVAALRAQDPSLQSDGV